MNRTTGVSPVCLKMIYTARQLEDLWKANGSNGQVVLPYRARLSPMATDWIKAKKITLGYSDDGVANVESPLKEKTASAPAAPGSFLWWCDGPCGTAKAALSAQARESSLGQIDIPSEPTKLVAVIRKIAAEIKSNRAPGALLMTQSAASALVFANRCPSLRAIVGTCLETVEQGLTQVAANVLVIEYPHKTLQQIRNLIARFVKAKRELSEEARKSLQELSTCG